MLHPTVDDAISISSNDSTSQYFVREKGLGALDSSAFHYSIYRFLSRFLGLAGNMEAALDLPLDWIDA